MSCSRGKQSAAKNSVRQSKKSHDVHAIGKGKQKSRSRLSSFKQHSSKNYKQQQKGEAQGRSQQSKIRDCEYCGRMHPIVSILHMALQKRYMVLTSLSTTSKRAVISKAITFLYACSYRWGHRAKIQLLCE